MIEKYEKKVLKLNAPLRGLPDGAEVKVKVDKKGTPIDRYWRDRLKDAKTDQCVEWLGKKAPAKTSTSKSGCE